MNSHNYLEQKKNTHLYFQIGENKYAVNSDNVLEIMKLPALDYPQKLPNNIIGLLKYNNFVISVIDVRFYLNTQVQPYSINNELLIIRTDEVIFGIITDKVLGILPFDSALTDAIPFVDSKIIIESIYKYNQETIFIINIYAIENLLKQHGGYDNNVDIQALFPHDEASKNIMSRRTLAIAKKSNLQLASCELHAKNKYISFNLNKDSYCIELDYISEVLKDTPITRVPGIPDYIEGIMNLRGDYITVLNLKRFLNLRSTDNSDRKPVIIVKCNELKIALLIDNINEMFEFMEDELPEFGDGYFSNEFIYNETLYTVLNVDKITSDKRIIITDM